MQTYTLDTGQHPGSLTGNTTEKSYLKSTFDVDNYHTILIQKCNLELLHLLKCLKQQINCNTNTCSQLKKRIKVHLLPLQQLANTSQHHKYIQLHVYIVLANPKAIYTIIRYHISQYWVYQISGISQRPTTISHQSYLSNIVLSRRHPQRRW